MQRSALVILCLVCLLLAPSAQAAPITWAFEARVDSGNQPVGGLVAGTITFDQARLNPVSGLEGLILRLTLSLPDGTRIDQPYTSGTAVFTTVVDGAGFDSVYFNYEEVAGNFFLTLEDPTGTALSSTLLPRIPPPASAWATREFVYFSGFSATVTSLTVPEPGMFLLFLTSLAALRGTRGSGRGLRVRLVADGFGKRAIRSYDG